MSHFYGSIPCSALRTMPTACAHKNTGLTIRAASWKGAIEVHLHHDPETGQDHFAVTQTTHVGQGITQMLAGGVLGEQAIYTP